MDDQEEPNNMQIFVKGVTERTRTFKINQDTQFRKLMLAYCDREQLPVDDVRFIYSGRLLRRDDTPQQLKMHNEGTIHVVLSLLGS